MNKDVRILIGLTTIFLILIGLSAAIYFNSRTLSCDKCNVGFKTTEMFGEYLPEPIVIRYNLSDLFGELNKGNCPVMWSRTQGYYYGN